MLLTLAEGSTGAGFSPPIYETTYSGDYYEQPIQWHCIYHQEH